MEQSIKERRLQEAHKVISQEDKELRGRVPKVYKKKGSKGEKSKRRGGEEYWSALSNVEVKKENAGSTRRRRRSGKEEDKKEKKGLEKGEEVGLVEARYKSSETPGRGTSVQRNENRRGKRRKGSKKRRGRKIRRIPWLPRRKTASWIRRSMEYKRNGKVEKKRSSPSKEALRSGKLPKGRRGVGRYRKEKGEVEWRRSDLPRGKEKGMEGKSEVKKRRRDSKKEVQERRMGEVVGSKDEVGKRERSKKVRKEQRRSRRAQKMQRKRRELEVVGMGERRKK